MELSTQTIYGLTNFTKKAYSGLKSAHEKRQERRLKEFLQYLDTRYELMTVEEQLKLNEFISSEMGEKILADYADSILKVSSSRATMAMTLLYCNEPEFTATEKITFIMAAKDISDDLIDFYLITHERERYEHENIPYARSSFSSDDCDELTKKGWDKESIAVYVHELIRLRLLLPDPLPITGYTSKANLWSLHYGVSSKTQKIINLLVKSEAMLKNSTL